MSRLSRLAVLPLFGGALTLAGAAGAAPMAMRSPADQALAGSMTTMQSQMAAAPMTGDADRDFVAMMLPHHVSAVGMARTELRYGRSPELRRMAHAIIDGQQREIGEMKAWQAAHPDG